MAGVARYPANPPGTSKHEKGLALDILSTNTKALVGLLNSVGLVWAGPADPIHFEIPSGRPVGAPRLNVPAPAKAKPLPLSRADELQALIDGVNARIMKPW